MVRIAAFQAAGPGSIPGECIFKIDINIFCFESVAFGGSRLGRVRTIRNNEP